MKYIGDILYNLPVHFFPLWKMSELLHDKSNKMTCSPSEYSDKLGHPLNLWSQPSLSAWRTLGPYSHPLSAQRRLWSDWMDAQSDMSLRWVHIPFCLFCHASAQYWILQFSAFQIQINYVLLYLIMPFWNIWHVKIYLQWPITYGKYGLGWQWPMLHNTLTVAEWANRWEWMCISTEGLQNNVLLND